MTIVAQNHDIVTVEPNSAAGNQFAQFVGLIDDPSDGDFYAIYSYATAANAYKHRIKRSPDDGDSWVSTRDIATGSTVGHEIGARPQPHFALSTGRWLRRLNGEDFDPAPGKTAYIQRSDDKGDTWANHGADYLGLGLGTTTTIQWARMQLTAGGALLAIGQDFQQDPPRSGIAFAKPMIRVSPSGTGAGDWTNALTLPANWGTPGEVGNLNVPSRLYANEWSVAELANGDLFAVIRTGDAGPTAPWNGTKGAQSYRYATIRLKKLATNSWQWGAAGAAYEVKPDPFPRDTSASTTVAPAFPDLVRVTVGAKDVLFFAARKDVSCPNSFYYSEDEGVTWAPIALGTYAPERDFPYYARIKVRYTSPGVPRLFMLAHKGKDVLAWPPDYDEGVFMHRFTLADPGGVGSKPGTPTFTPPASTVNAPLSVTITSAGSTSIRYTTDGTNPTATSTLYSAPVQVTATTTLKASGFNAAGQGAIGTAVYTFDTTPPTTPDIQPASGSYASAQTVTMTAEAGASIRYTTDGSRPGRGLRRLAYPAITSTLVSGGNIAAAIAALPANGALQLAAGGSYTLTADLVLTAGKKLVGPASGALPTITGNFQIRVYGDDCQLRRLKINQGWVAGKNIEFSGRRQALIDCDLTNNFMAGGPGTSAGWSSMVITTADGPSAVCEDFLAYGNFLHQIGFAADANDNHSHAFYLTACNRGQMHSNRFYQLRGGYAFHGYPDTKNTEITQNFLESGLFAILWQNAAGDVSGNTIHHNAWHSTYTGLNRSVVGGNTGTGQGNVYDHNAGVTTNTAYGGAAGIDANFTVTNNLPQDPQFVSPSTGDFTIGNDTVAAHVALPNVGTLYSGPIQVSQSGTFNAVAVDPAGNESAETVRAYTITGGTSTRSFGGAPAGAASQDSAGTAAWTNVGNVLADDDAIATASVGPGTPVTNGIITSSHGIATDTTGAAIPDTADILTVTAAVSRSKSGTQPVKDAWLSWRKADGTKGPNVAQDPATEPAWPTTEAERQYELSAVGLKGSDVKAAGFGLYFQARNDGASANFARPDQIRIVGGTFKLAAATPTLGQRIAAAPATGTLELAAGTYTSLLLDGVIKTNLLVKPAAGAEGRVIIAGENLQGSGGITFQGLNYVGGSHTINNCDDITWLSCECSGLEAIQWFIDWDSGNSDRLKWQSCIWRDAVAPAGTTPVAMNMRRVPRTLDILDSDFRDLQGIYGAVLNGFPNLGRLLGDARINRNKFTRVTAGATLLTSYTDGVEWSDNLVDGGPGLVATPQESTLRGEHTNLKVLRNASQNTAEPLLLLRNVPGAQIRANRSPGNSGVTGSGIRIYWSLEGAPGQKSTNLAFTDNVAGRILVEDGPLAGDVVTYSELYGNQADVSAGDFNQPAPPAPPTPSVPPGTYQDTQTVVLSSAPGTTIRYTLDGTTPTRSSTLYTAPISITQTRTLSAITVSNLQSVSVPFGGLYTIAAVGPGPGPDVPPPPPPPPPPPAGDDLDVAPNLIAERAVSLIAQTGVHTQGQDPENDRILEGMMRALLEPMLRVSLLAHGNGAGVNSWEILTNPQKAPLWAMPFALQWVGGDMPPRRGAETNTAYLERVRVEAARARNMRRGSLESILDIAASQLDASLGFRLVPRYGGDRWTHALIVSPNDPAPRAQLAATLNAPNVVPAGARVIVIDSDEAPWDLATRTWDAVPATVTWDSATADDVAPTGGDPGGGGPVELLTITDDPLDDTTIIGG